jgi:hypothetical protein
MILNLSPQRHGDTEKNKPLRYGLRNLGVLCASVVGAGGIK